MDLISVDDAAAMAHVHRNTIIYWIRNKILPARRKGFGKSPYRIQRADLEALLARRDAGTNPK